ncbi:ABC transporter ATP-binding protein [Thermopolyspora sp. NPDC052614]|uniref:ABC transporter ATP-binding protein n=1 Tax=Thermopolyspora sp. NPDC052614 TaxID=3155682 RepID=UPI003416226C
MIRLLLGVVGAASAARVRRYLATLIALAVAQGLAFAVIVPVLRALLGGDLDAAWPWLGALAGMVAVCAVLQYRQAMMGFAVGLDLSRSLYHRLGDHLSALPLGWFDTDRVGRVGQLVVQGVRAVMNVPAHLLQPLVIAYLTPATVVVVSVVFDWRLSVALAVAGLLLVLTYRYTARVNERSDRRLDATGVEAGSRVVEYAQAQAVLRGFGRSGEANAELEAALTAQHAAGRRQITSLVPGLALNALVVQAAYTVLIALGTYLVLGGSLGAAELIALLALATRFTEPLMLAAELGGTVRVGRANLERFAEIFAVEPLPEPAEGSRPATPAGDTPPPAVELDRVTFGYDAAAPVLHEVSLRIPPRTMTALVGPSGSGKTTVTRLIARFHDPESGVVRVDGHDVRDLTTEDLMSRLSLVFQDVYLFDDTIEENIRLGRPGATEEEVRHAAALARVDEIVERLPDGWRTRVGESGATLSGGERQRVSIARAILKDAPIVLLDEATAALDPENEAAVTAALHALTSGKTLLVIAHRLSTVMAADQIVVLDRGRVAESGDHASLLALDGRYARFWRERSRAQGWRLTRAS